MSTVVESFERLEPALEGAIVRPGDADYDEKRRLWNAMFDRRPSAIVRCRGVADVQATVRFARENQLPFTVLAGGHSAIGSCLQDDILAIDLREMTGVHVDPDRGRAIVEAGNRLRKMDRELQVHGLAITGGVVSDTGVAGLTLGGGFGWLMRKFGATIDSLVSVDAVTVDGGLVRCSADQEPELFWGMRGGYGNFAIVTAFEFAPRSLRGPVFAGQIFHAGDQATDVVSRWRDFMDDAPDEVGSQILIMRAPYLDFIPSHLQGELIVAYMLVWSGDLAEGLTVLAPARSWGDPFLDTLHEMPYTQLQQHQETWLPRHHRQYEKGGYVAALDEGAIETLVAGARRSPSIAPNSQDVAVTAITAMGGAFSRVDDDETALPRGDARYFWELVSFWYDPVRDDEFMPWARALAAQMAPLSRSQTYLNLGTDATASVRDAFGDAKYERLVALKDRWDPENVLRFTKNVQPSAGAAVGHPASVEPD